MVLIPVTAGAIVPSGKTSSEVILIRTRSSVLVLKIVFQWRHSVQEYSNKIDSVGDLS